MYRVVSIGVGVDEGAAAKYIFMGLALVRLSILYVHMRRGVCYWVVVALEGYGMTEASATQPTPRELAEEAAQEYLRAINERVRGAADTLPHLPDFIERAITKAISVCEARAYARAYEIAANVCDRYGSSYFAEKIRSLAAPEQKEPFVLPLLCTHDWETVSMPGCTAPKVVYRCKTCGETNNSMWERP